MILKSLKTCNKSNKFANLDNITAKKQQSTN